MEGALAGLGGAAVMAGHLMTERPVRWLLDANGLFAVSPILVLAMLRRRAPDATSQSAVPTDRAGRVQRALWLITLLYVLLYVLLTPKRHGDRLIPVLRAAGIEEFLFVAWPPGDHAISEGSQVLNDAPLNFISVELRPIRIDADPDGPG